MIKEDLQVDMLEEVIQGLKQPQKMLPSKYFYDERGSRLFEEITKLEEYYPTRTERKILKDNVNEIGQHLGDQVVLIEPGSGSSDKTRILLEELNNISAYIPIDISGRYLNDVGQELQLSFPDIKIQPVVADYTRPFKLPDNNMEGRKVVFFPGSTIGNFERNTVERFLDVVSTIVGSEGGFLIGVDLKKEVRVLEEAYNDSKGITAAFNKNILMHLNRELDSNFDPELFRHQAIWNEEAGRIEMHLFARAPHDIHINGELISMEEGESIHTENSHKYHLDEFADIVSPWFDVKKVWTDDQQLFSVQYLEPK